jgi:REP element-mobilizing transposase RayT
MNSRNTFPALSSGQRQKLIAINNLPDHLHLLIGLRPDSVLSELVGENRILELYQSKAMDFWKVFLARGFRSFLPFTVTVGFCDSLHQKPTKTSHPKIVSRGVH